MKYVNKWENPDLYLTRVSGVYHELKNNNTVGVKTNMHQHTYLTRIDDQTFLDLKRVKELEGRSINSLLNEGAKQVRDRCMEKIAQQRKTRNSMEGIVGW